MAQNRAQSLVGQQVGPYKIHSLLGVGGMGEVYLAQDPRLDRTIALKILPTELASDPARIQRFIREARAASGLKHPNVATIYEIGKSEEFHFIAMEYVEGQTLAAKINGGPLPLAEIVDIGIQVADALDEAHRKGITHRDIKPVNLMLTSRDQVKVLDFGLAKVTLPEGQALESDISTVVKTETGVVMGTVQYMSPEQVLGKEVDHRTDIFSLGVVFYEMATGRSPFTGTSSSETMDRVLHGQPEAIARFNYDVPAELERIIRKCLEKDRERRYQSGRDLLIDLKNLKRDSDAAPVAGHDLGLPTMAASKDSRLLVFRSRWLSARSVAVLASVVVLALAATGWFLHRSDSFWENPLAGAHFERFTDFEGSELDAAISSDGKFVALLSDRDGPFDVWVSQVGSGEFMNLTKGRFQILTDFTRSVGFSADGANVCLLVMRPDPSRKSMNSTIWLTPTIGGTSRPFLENAVTAVWSPDGSRIVYHENTPGDPIFIAERNGSNPKQIFIEKPGLHCHYPAWSRDSRFVYFVRGFAPNEMDIWRISSAGGGPQRITHHNSRVAYPTLLDDRTLIYTAPAEDGSGVWLYATDVERRIPHRVSFGVEHYLSVSASSDGRRLAATVANPSGNLWTVPILEGIAEESTARRFALPNVRVIVPRFGPNYLLYLSSRGGANGIWKFKGGIASELWKASEGSVPAAPAISPDGQQICFSVHQQGQGRLYSMTEDGTNVRSLAESLDVRGAMSWSPDGKWIVVAADEEKKGIRVFKIPVDGGKPVRITDQISYNPVWSPDGRFIVYHHAVRGNLWPVKAVTPDGQPFSLPDLLALGEGDRYRFLPNGKGIVLLQGELRRQDFWLFDLQSGRQRQLTNLTPGFSMKSFDISPDGKQIMFDRVRENSDIVLIDLPQR